MRADVKLIRECLKLYLVMGSTNCKINALEVVEQAIAGGITLLQLREKGPNALGGKARDAFARQVQQRCRQHGIPLIVNDDIEWAAALQADGVHIGQDDAPLPEVRKLLGDRIIGVSVHNLEEAQQAMDQGADYLGIGPIYATSTKLDAQAVQGTKLIHTLRAQGITIPIVGIGGITAERAGAVMDAGADGVAVVSAITMAGDVTLAASNLLQQVTREEDVS
ncbi:thiamine phosphate synthase [Paenibacillus guangzhouensis]|uniref:thiamine phosphate synthase n=1 Tax=Paenibacillus guangzhouensis TaxID=1473112 RepID=UPI001266BF00|nr:thiamine phosphate synthase [Paenibacillus guangzhouensis]